MSVRCKFRCVAKTQRPHWKHEEGFLYEYEFHAVSDEGSAENANFFAATPSGSLKVGTVLDGTFGVGHDYYLDLTLAEQ